MGSLRSYWQHLYSDSLSFYRLLLTECDDFALLTICYGRCSQKSSNLSFHILLIQSPANLHQFRYSFTSLYHEVTFFLLIEIRNLVFLTQTPLQIEIYDVFESLACILTLRQKHGIAQGDVSHIILGWRTALLHHRLGISLHLAKQEDVASIVEPKIKRILDHLQPLRLLVIIDIVDTRRFREVIHHSLQEVPHYGDGSPNMIMLYHITEKHRAEIRLENLHLFRFRLGTNHLWEPSFIAIITKGKGHYPKT